MSQILSYLKQYKGILTVIILTIAALDALVGFIMAIVAWADTLGVIGLLVFFGSMTISAILIALAVIINPKEKEHE